MSEGTSPSSAASKVRLILEIARMYPRVRQTLRSKDLRTALEELRATSVVQPAGPDHIDIGLHLGRAVSRTLRVLPVDGRCLTQAVVLCTLLARRGISCRVVIGVRPGEDFGAHAWVEIDGRPLLPPGASDYPRLVEL